jgi:hypothetical protein
MNKILKTVFTLVAVGMHSLMQAQTTPPPPPGGAPPGFPVPYVIALAVAALGYGVYKHSTNPKK